MTSQDFVARTVLLGMTALALGCSAPALSSHAIRVPPIGRAASFVCRYPVRRPSVAMAIASDVDAPFVASLHPESGRIELHEGRPERFRAVLYGRSFFVEGWIRSDEVLNFPSDRWLDPWVHVGADTGLMIRAVDGDGVLQVHLPTDSGVTLDGAALDQQVRCEDVISGSPEDGFEFPPDAPLMRIAEGEHALFRVPGGPSRTLRLSEAREVAVLERAGPHVRIAVPSRGFGRTGVTFVGWVEERNLVPRSTGPTLPSCDCSPVTYAVCPHSLSFGAVAAGTSAPFYELGVVTPGTPIILEREPSIPPAGESMRSFGLLGFFEATPFVLATDETLLVGCETHTTSNISALVHAAIQGRLRSTQEASPR